MKRDWLDTHFIIDGASKKTQKIIKDKLRKGLIGVSKDVNSKHNKYGNKDEKHRKFTGLNY